MRGNICRLVGFLLGVVVLKVWDVEVNLVLIYLMFKGVDIVVK